MMKPWEECFSPEIVAWAWGCIGKLIGLYQSDNVTNFRVADKSKSNHKRRYRKQREQGCCGFVDHTITGPDGKKYWIGFNWGH